MIEKNFLVDLSEKSEAKTPKKPEKTEKFLCIRRKKQRGSRINKTLYKSESLEFSIYNFLSD